MASWRARNCADDGAELLRLLQVRAVAGVGEDVAFRAWDLVDVRLPGVRGRLVELAGDDQRRCGDLGQPVDDAPARAACRGRETRWGRSWCGTPSARPPSARRCRRGPAASARPGRDGVVELVRRRQVLRVGDGARLLVTDQRVLDVGRQRIAPTRRSLPSRAPSRPASCRSPPTSGRAAAGPRSRRRACRPTTGRAGGTRRCPVLREPCGTPRRRAPVSRSRRAHRAGRAVAATDLVVVDDRAAGFVGEFGEVAHVVVRHAGAAVQDEEGQGAWARIVGRGDLDPGFVAAEGDRRVVRGMESAWTRKGLMTRPLIGI